VGLALISTLVLSNPKPVVLLYIFTGSSLIPLTFLSKACNSAGVNFSYFSSASSIPNAAFILCWSLFLAYYI